MFSRMKNDNKRQQSRDFFRAHSFFPPRKQEKGACAWDLRVLTDDEGNPP
jgi:hypothetical protein